MQLRMTSRRCSTSRHSHDGRGLYHHKTRNWWRIWRSSRRIRPEGSEDPISKAKRGGSNTTTPYRSPSTSCYVANAQTHRLLLHSAISESLNAVEQKQIPNRSTSEVPPGMWPSLTHPRPALSTVGISRHASAESNNGPVGTS